MFENAYYSHNLNDEIELQSANEHGSTKTKRKKTTATAATEKSVWGANKRAISFAFYYICTHLLYAVLAYTIQFSSALA